MRVLILANKYPFPARDGSSIAILSSLRAWSMSGAEVHLFALNPRKSRVKPDKLPSDLQSKVITHTFDINTDVSAMGAITNLLGHRPYHISRFYRRDIGDWLDQILEDNDFDVVQWEGPFMGEYLPHFKKKKCVHWLRAHNIEHRIWQRMAQRSKNPFKRWYLQVQSRRLREFELKFARKMHGLLAITSVDLSYIQEKTPQLKSLVWLPGLDLRQYPQWVDPHNKSIAAIASFDWEPNREGMQWFLNEVLPLLDQSIEVKIGGRNMPSNWLTDYPRVRWTPKVENAHQFVLDACINFVPLWSGSGIRIKIVEAAGMGIPFVATSIAAEGSGLTHQQELSIADTPEEFAAAIHQLLDTPTLRNEYSQKARTFAFEHYDIQTLGENLIAFYRQNFS